VLWAKAAKKLTKPFLASGGIGDGKQLAAALCLGAAGVNLGTRFGCTSASWLARASRALRRRQEED